LNISHVVHVPLRLRRPVYITRRENFQLFSSKSVNRLKLEVLTNRKALTYQDDDFTGF